MRFFPALPVIDVGHNQAISKVDGQVLSKLSQNRITPLPKELLMPVEKHSQSTTNAKYGSCRLSIVIHSGSWISGVSQCLLQQ